jgi:hypothetical protein
MRRMIVVVVLLGVTALAGCSGQDAEDAATNPDVERVTGVRDVGGPADAPDDGAAEAVARDADAAHGDTGGTSDTTVPAVSRVAGRRVIRTAEIELVSDDTDETVDEVMRLADRSGGFVATTDLRRDDEDLLRGTVILRVPSADLVEVLRDLQALAVRTPVSRIDEHDVTDETSDLEARLTNLTTYEQELRSLLADVREDTSSPDDLLRIFERIREVRAEIDTIDGRLASLADQVELATVAVHLEPSRTALAVTDPTWRPLETVREALTAAARGLSRVADVAIWVAVGVLPVLLVVALPPLALAVAWRRSRRRTPPGAPDPAM